MSTAKNESPNRLQAEFNVSRKNHVAFKKKMKGILPVLFDQYRWELVYAAYPIVGNINRFTQIWKIPDETSVLQVMRDGAADDAAAPAASVARGAPELSLQLFEKLYQDLQGIISRTTHVLTTSLPHDPTYFGHQTQTLLVDARGETFLIDNARMRRELASNDIAEGLQTARRQRWSCWKNADALNEKQRSARPEPTAPDPSLRAFLNHGALVARLDHSLLFNLAGIEPRSVFQEDLDSEKERARKEARLAKGNGKVEFPAGINTLLISTPWGAVYEVKPDDLKPIATPIPKDQVQATARVLVPLIQAQVPIANIPEERDEVIGDGCMCYVINLASFDGELTERAFGKQTALFSGEKSKET